MQILFVPTMLIIFLITYFTSKVEAIALLGFIEVVISICFIAKRKNKLLSICVLFLMFSYLVHCGQYLLIIIDTGVIPTLDFTKKVSSNTLLLTGKFIVYAHGVLALGMLWNKIGHRKIKLHSDNSIFRISKNKEISNIIIDKNKPTLRKIAYVFIIIGLFFSLRTTIKLISLMIGGGYYNTFSYYANYGGIRTQLGTLWVVGIIILLTIYRKNVTRCRILLFISVSYLLVTMLTGGRISALMNIAVLIFYYFNLIEKLKIGKIILLGVIGVILVQYVVNVGLSRNSGFGVSVDFRTSLKTLIGQVLAEFGGTSYTVALVMDHIPYEIGYAYGITYPLSLIYILPNFGWSSLSIISTTVFTDYLYQYTTSGIGGTYIGEAYYNAGYFGLMLLYLFGVFLSWFERRVDEYMEKGKWIELIAYMGTMPYILLMTRSFFKDIVRPFVWLTIGVYLLKQLFVRERT